jgi:hypothetical protein
VHSFTSFPRRNITQYPENYVLLFCLGSFYISYFLLAYIETIFIVRDSDLFSGHVPTKRLLISCFCVIFVILHTVFFSDLRFVILF